MAEHGRITEDRLDALRQEAARTGTVHDRGIVPSGSPFPDPTAGASYYGHPVLKTPTWTWEVPLYFFAGGAAGIAALIALAAHVRGDATVARAASWIALTGGLISPVLLISDLGRPARFLNMLRVFKLRSAMSVGAWTLVGFSSAAALAVVCRELLTVGHGPGLLLPLEWTAEVVAALTGLLLASYTSVLLGVSAIPVWSENRTLIPAVFLTGALGSAGAILELLGFLIPATQFIGIVASIAETVIAITIEARHRYVDRPLREGAVGGLTRVGAALAGPTALLLRVVPGHSPGPRYAAAACFIAGALIARYAWLAAGRISSRDPEALFRIQRRQG
jgi:Polysulphide reductase, NrfD